jgi:hypothetical protein
VRRTMADATRLSRVHQGLHSFGMEGGRADDISKPDMTRAFRFSHVHTAIAGILFQRGHSFQTSLLEVKVTFR